jgi:hypothetical protein
MVDRRCCWLDVAPSVFVWMGIVVVNGLVVASTVFGIVLGYLRCNENGFPFACYEDVFFLEYIDTLLHEDQNFAVI